VLKQNPQYEGTYVFENGYPALKKNTPSPGLYLKITCVLELVHRVFKYCNGNMLASDQLLSALL
jgi:galactose-1-phosphate uridylyltransferase